MFRVPCSSATVLSINMFRVTPVPEDRARKVGSDIIFANIYNSHKKMVMIMLISHSEDDVDDYVGLCWL